MPEANASAIRQLYPEKKLTTANYKGFAARCEGLLCVRDMTKPETLEFFDKIISDYHVNAIPPGPAPMIIKSCMISF